MQPTILLRVSTLALTLFAVLYARPVLAQWQPYEIGIAQREAGRIRALAERLSKENLLYQLHLGETSKQDMHDTSAELDRILAILEVGSTFYSVAGPPSEAVRKQIQKVGEFWIPVRKLAVASPYDYLRRAQQFVPPESPRGDPLIIRAFDRMVRELVDEAVRLMSYYNDECIKTDYRLCAVAQTSGHPTMLAERMIKEVVFVHAGMDIKRNVERLRENRDFFEANHVGFAESDLYRSAIDASRGERAAFVAGLRQSIDTRWSQLRYEIDLAISGRVNEIDLRSILKIQSALVDDIERFTAVLGRFAAGEYGRDLEPLMKF